LSYSCTQVSGVQSTIAKGVLQNKVKRLDVLVHAFADYSDLTTRTISIHEISWYENSYSAVPKVNTDLIIWLQDNKNHTTRIRNGFACGRDLMSEIEENTQVKIAFIRSFFCLSFYNNLLLLNMHAIYILVWTIICYLLLVGVHEKPS